MEGAYLLCFLDVYGESRRLCRDNDLAPAMPRDLRAVQGNEEVRLRWVGRSAGCVRNGTEIGQIDGGLEPNVVVRSPRIARPRLRSGTRALDLVSACDRLDLGKSRLNAECAG